MTTAVPRRGLRLIILVLAVGVVWFASSALGVSVNREFCYLYADPGRYSAVCLGTLPHFASCFP
jgi:hypothetical protein